MSLFAELKAYVEHYSSLLFVTVDGSKGQKIRIYKPYKGHFINYELSRHFEGKKILSWKERYLRKLFEIRLWKYLLLLPIFVITLLFALLSKTLKIQVFNLLSSLGFALIVYLIISSIFLFFITIVIQLSLKKVSPEIYQKSDYLLITMLRMKNRNWLPIILGFLFFSTLSYIVWNIYFEGTENIVGIFAAIIMSSFSLLYAFLIYLKIRSKDLKT